MTRVRCSLLLALAVSACSGDSPKLLAELRGENLTLSSNNVTQGSMVTVSFVMRNDGSAPADSIIYKTELLGGDGGLSIDLGRRTVAGLLNQANVAQMYAVAIPASAPAGAYTLQVTLDPDNAIPESDENNNVLTGSAPVVIRPRGANVNLVPSSLTVTPATTSPDELVNLAYTLRNAGSDGILANTKTFFYLSTDATFSNDDVKIGEQTVGALGAGLSVNLMSQVTIPAGTAQGMYSVIAVVNAENTVTETETADNVTVASVTIGSGTVEGIDLVVTNLTVSPLAVPRRGLVTISFTIKNRGNMPTQSFLSRIYLSPSNTPNPMADPILANVNETGLDANAQKQYERVITLADTVTPGAYFITVFADATAAVTETNNDNNIRVSSSALIVQPPAMADVEMSNVDVTLEPTPVDGGVSADGGVAPDAGAAPDAGTNADGGTTLVVPAGATLSISFKVRNVGPDASGAFGVALVLSANDTFEAADRVLKTVPVATLMTGEERTLTETVAIPTDTGAQPFFVAVVADPLQDQLVDPVRTNNVAFWANTVRISGGSGCTDDMFEPNDNRDGGAARITPGTYNNLALCPANEDHYLINVPVGSSLRAGIVIAGDGTSTSRTDLDMTLYSPTGGFVDSATGSTPTDEVTADFVTAGGDYTVRIYPGSTGSTASYSMTVTVVESGGNGVDLVPLNQSFGSATQAGPGEPFQIRFTARNVGAMPMTSTFEYDLRLVPVAGSTCTATISLGRFTAEPLTAGASRSITQDVTVPMMGACAGTYNARVTLDPREQITETFENNNIITGTATFRVLETSLCADQFEPNNTRATATPIAQGQYNDLRICSGADDWYVISLAQGEQLRVVLNFVDADGDVDMSLQNEAGTTLASSGGVTDMEQITYTSTIAQRVYLRVYVLGTANSYNMGITGGAGIDLVARAGSFTPSAQVAGEDVQVNFTVDNTLTQRSTATTAAIRFVQGASTVLGLSVPVPILGPGAPDGTSKSFNAKFPVPASLTPGVYDITVTVDPDNTIREGSETNNAITLAGFRVLGACAPDASEPNDSFALADDVTPVDAMTPTTLSNLSVCPGDLDWFQVVVPAGTFTLSASITFANMAGDLDLYLYRVDAGALVPLARSAGNMDNETITQTGVTAGTYVMKVQGFSGATNASYNLTVGLTPAP